MTELKWTKEMPTQKGFYWAKCHSTIDNKPFLSVIKTSFTLKGIGYGWWDGEHVALDDERFVAFAGPIPEPTE